MSGKFLGRVETEWSLDGRKMILLAPFSYRSEAGKIYRVPAGTTVDGASIYWVLWTFSGSPYVGTYRRATVIHDFLCQQKNLPWQEVHDVFYEAMLADGTPKFRAWKMWKAVRHFGPRWPDPTT